MAKKPRTVADVIRELRSAKGMSQRELAEQVDVTREYIARLETGEQGSPSLHIAKRIAEVCGKNLSIFDSVTFESH